MRLGGPQTWCYILKEGKICFCQDLKLTFAWNDVKASEQIFIKFGIEGFY